jgi:hypothetical protein
MRASGLGAADPAPLSRRLIIGRLIDYFLFETALRKIVEAIE